MQTSREGPILFASGCCDRHPQAALESNESTGASMIEAELWQKLQLSVMQLACGKFSAQATH